MADIELGVTNTFDEIHLEDKEEGDNEKFDYLPSGDIDNEYLDDKDYERVNTKSASESQKIPYSTIHNPPLDFDDHRRTCFVPAQRISADIIAVEQTGSNKLVSPNLYTIVLKHGDHEWTIMRRYKHFRHLHDQLRLFRARLHIPMPSASVRSRRKSFANRKQELPKFPRIPDSLLKREDMGERKEQLQNYLRCVLRCPQYRNHYETLKFVEVSHLSFVSQLGPKRKEGVIKKRSGGRKFGYKCCRCCGRCMQRCTARWSKRWLMLKDSYVAVLHPDTGVISEVMLIDQFFNVVSGKEKTGYTHGIIISNYSRDLHIKCWTQRKALAWKEAIEEVAQGVARELSQNNRYESFVPPRTRSYANWFVDGASYMYEVADAIENAKEEIFITDWMLSPEIYLKRPMTEGTKWRLDVMLKRKAEQGVKVYVLLFKEMEMALGINSYYSKQQLIRLHQNIKVLRHPDGLNFWSHHEKCVVVDQTIAFLGGVDLCYGRWDTPNHRLTDLGSVLKSSSLENIAAAGDVPKAQHTGELFAMVEKQSFLLHPSVDDNIQQNELDLATSIVPMASPEETFDEGSVEVHGSCFDEPDVVMEDLPLDTPVRSSVVPRVVVEDEIVAVSETAAAMASAEEELIGHENYAAALSLKYRRQVSWMEQAQQMSRQVSISGSAVSGEEMLKVGAEAQKAMAAPDSEIVASDDKEDNLAQQRWGRAKLFATWKSVEEKETTKPPSSEDAQAIGLKIPNNQNEKARDMWSAILLNPKLLNSSGRAVNFSKVIRGYKPKPTTPPPRNKLHQAAHDLKEDIKDIFRFGDHDSTIDLSSELGSAEVDYENYASIPKPGEAMDDLGLEGSSKLWIGKDYANFIQKDFVDLDQPFTDFIDRTSMPRMPWHDIACMVYGKSARDVARHFIQRWNATKSEKRKKNRDFTILLPKSYSQISVPASCLKSAFPCTTQILRSCAEWSGGISKIEQSIQYAYCELISCAKHYVYIENQFFVTVGNSSEVHNAIADALYNRIIRAHNDQETFRVFVVMPLLPAFEGEIGTNTGSAIQAVTHWNYLSICRGGNSLIERLLKRTRNVIPYISFYGLRTHGELMGQLQSELVYVHSKLMIIDDNTVLIGSANINDRSMVGNRDSELALVVNDTKFVDSRMNGKPYKAGWYATTLRKTLFREHLGVIDDSIDITDPIIKSFYEGVWITQASINTSVYDEVFRTVPNDEVQSYAQLHEFQKKTPLAVGDPEAAREKLQKVRGHLVLLPLTFLSEENLLPAVGTKEGLVPTQIWT